MTGALRRCCLKGRFVMVKIAPSILSADFCRLGREIDCVSTADWLHVDVMDGRFVPNITFGLPVVRAIRQYTDMFLDVHLMVEQPGRYVADFAQAGANLLSLHLESGLPPAIHAALDEAARCGAGRGIVLRPITAAEAVVPYLRQGLDLILLMTVEPGYGGQAFLESQLVKISRVREYIQRYCPGCALEVDGGINALTARACIQAGADVLVAGSFIFGAADRAAAIAALRGQCGKS